MEGQMMKTTHYLSLIVLLMATMPVLSQTKDASKPQASPQKTKDKSASTTTAQQDDGERVFEQNCSRCHNAPQGFSPRIAGTVVKHMRVRANLSEADAKAVLRFFNP
jgi:cytochrome c5